LGSSGLTGRAKLCFAALYSLAFAAHLPWVLEQVRQKSELWGSDFTIFYSGWTLVLRGRGHDLYDAVAQRAVERELMHGLEFPGGLVPFLHPPHAAVLMAPLAWLSRTPATWVWTLVQLGLLAWLVRALWRVLGPAAAQAPDRWLVTAAVLAFPPVFACLQMGQLSILLAAALLELVLAAEAGRDGVAALCLLVLSFKPHLALVPVAVLVAARRWGVLARAAALGAAAAGLATAVLGTRIWAAYVTQLPRLESYWGKGGPEFMVDLRGALLRLPGASATVANAVSLAGLALAVGAAYVVVRRRLARGGGLADAWPPALALALFFNPHVFLHDALLWVVPLALHAARLRRQGADLGPFALFALSWPMVGLVNEIAERNDRLLPVHLLVVEAVVGVLWLMAPGPAAAQPTVRTV
jgi:hypothetical protein